jgi:hypothetical protein
MKKFVISIIVICLITASCAKSTISNIELNRPVRTQKYVGRLKGNVSLTREFGDKIIVQKEQENSFDIYNVDINTGILDFDYTINSQGQLLYSKQLDGERVLKVKQLGNSEENNMLVLEGKTTKNIASKIAYSTAALVSTSISQRYIIYCAVDDIPNHYSLYIYDLETGKGLQLIDTVNEELLNDMEWNISWSPDETYVLVSNELIFNASNGKLICEISADNALWSSSSSKLAYIKSEKSYGKSICILDLSTIAIEEVFLANSDEYLPGYFVWSGNEEKLGFVTALIDRNVVPENIIPYKSIYSLDLTTKEAIRIDTSLRVDEKVVENLQSMHYNSSGSIIAFSSSNYFGCDLYVYNINTGNSEFFINIEYLHHENNESYVCSAGSMYIVQGQSVIELDEDMNCRLIYKSKEAIDDIYISQNGSSMIIIEKSIDEIIFRQLVNFAEKSM